VTAIQYQPLASEEDLKDSPFKYALQGASASFIQSTLTRASRAIEARCARRFAPFGPVTQTERAEGVTSENTTATDIPLSLTGTLQLSRARAYGQNSNLVRDIWLDDYAPRHPELWTYSAVSVLIIPPFGGQGQSITQNLVGPEPDSGHLRLPFGTYCPVGSIVETTYSGGYTGGVPDDLVQATMMQAVRLFILSIAPERRASMSTADLDAEIGALIKPYART
jgi:hypothetical protein